MKNIFLIGGILTLIFNTIAGLVLSSYHSMNWIIGDVSILFTTILIVALYSKYMENAFKAAFSFLFLIAGFIRFLICFFIPPQIQNNWLVLVVFGLLFFELLIFVFGVVLKKK
ncbi:MAG: hypothetical protein MK105_02955 [Crocinitomicaceae bacterium]|nr:hypothetical protein [Crocinitomicaceae bacterium]